MSGVTNGASRLKTCVVLLISLALLSVLPGCARADPTWPSPTDDLEEIMYQLKAFRGRRFSEYVSPSLTLLM